MLERQCPRCKRMGFRVPVGVTRLNTWIFCGFCGAKGPVHLKWELWCNFGPGDTDANTASL